MPADIDFGSRVDNGKAVQRRFQFGNMIVSRWPVLSMRGHLLPRSMRNSQPQPSARCAGGADRHAGRADPLLLLCISITSTPTNGMNQIESAEGNRLFRRRDTGMAITGLGEFGYPELPQAEDFILLGDFNFEPDLAEYRDMLVENGHLDRRVGRRFRLELDRSGKGRAQQTARLRLSRMSRSPSAPVTP